MKSFLTHCPVCDRELGEEDTVDWRILDPRHNKLSIGEFHYMALGAMLATILFFWMRMLGLV